MNKLTKPSTEQTVEPKKYADRVAVYTLWNNIRENQDIVKPQLYSSYLQCEYLAAFLVERTLALHDLIPASTISKIHQLVTHDVLRCMVPLYCPGRQLQRTKGKVIELYERRHIYPCPQ